jgi:uncharacterized membrane protein YqhA
MNETPNSQTQPGSRVERVLELFLWNTRFMIVVPVIMSIGAALAVLFVTTVDALGLFGRIFAYADPGLSTALRTDFRLDVLAQTVTIIDGYLLTAILLIFGLGLYELFVGKINIAEGSSFAARLLHIASIDDLKNRLARVVLLILIVKFFQLALGLTYNNPQDLLFLALSILLIAGALYLSSHEKS